MKSSFCLTMVAKLANFLAATVCTPTNHLTKVFFWDPIFSFTSLISNSMGSPSKFFKQIRDPGHISRIKLMAKLAVPWQQMSKFCSVTLLHAYLTAADDAFRPWWSFAERYATRRSKHLLMWRDGARSLWSSCIYEYVRFLKILLLINKLSFLNKLKSGVITCAFGYDFSFNINTIEQIKWIIDHFL